MIEEEQKLREMFEEAVKIIMNEFGFTREEVIDYLGRMIESHDR